MAESAISGYSNHTGVPAPELADRDASGHLTIIPIKGIGEVNEGDELGQLILDACGNTDRTTDSSKLLIAEGDVLVVTQKVVSKAEGRIVVVDEGDPRSHLPFVESEAVRIVRRRGDLVITETRHGFICANSGVDRSNMASGTAALLPIDPDRSANRIRTLIRRRAGIEVGVIVSDTFGRPWRRGLVDVAIGCSGIGAIVDLRGQRDSMGRELMVTEICIADEIAGAAELVMGKASSIPACIIRGIDPSWLRESSVAAEVVRPPSEDLFR
ncbi:MAG TPA: coenzyme F420-0:L-glutamate ligase [Acidimicrobiales bacterium]|nr:coenzyme F420-0:L-glutamate ligase [Acidimicrobiales bacterium]